MPEPRRVITQVGAAGKSVFAVAGPARTITKIEPGFVLSDIWRLDSPPRSASDGYEPASYALVPSPTGVVFRTFVIPPDSIVLPQLGALRAALGGQADISLDEATYGMHQTATIDFITVISGEVDLRLDDEQE